MAKYRLEEASFYDSAAGVLHPKGSDIDMPDDFWPSHTWQALDEKAADILNKKFDYLEALEAWEAGGKKTEKPVPPPPFYKPAAAKRRRRATVLKDEPKVEAKPEPSTFHEMGKKAKRPSDQDVA